MVKLLVILASFLAIYISAHNNYYFEAMSYQIPLWLPLCLVSLAIMFGWKGK